MPKRVKAPPRPHLFRMYAAQGRTIREVADHYGVDYKVARRWLIRYGIELRPNGPPPDLVRRREVARRKAARKRARTRRQAPPRTTIGAQKGGRPPSMPPDPELFRRQSKVMNLGELAALYGKPPATVRAWLTRAGHAVPDGRRRKDKPTPEALRQMRDEGLTLAEIGTRYGVSRQAVHKWFAQNP